MRQRHIHNNHVRCTYGTASPVKTAKSTHRLPSNLQLRFYAGGTAENGKHPSSRNERGTPLRTRPLPLTMKREAYSVRAQNSNSTGRNNVLRDTENKKKLKKIDANAARYLFAMVTHRNAPYRSGVTEQREGRARRLHHGGSVPHAQIKESAGSTGTAA